MLASINLLVICEPYNVSIRKSIYYVNTIMAAIQLTAWVIFIIYIFTSDYAEYACLERIWTMTNSVTFDSCVFYVNLVAIISTVVVVVIGIPMNLCCIQILYYGWKEQEQITRQR